MAKRQRDTSKSVPVEANANMQKQETPKYEKPEGTEVDALRIKVNMKKSLEHMILVKHHWNKIPLIILKWKTYHIR